MNVTKEYRTKLGICITPKMELKMEGIMSLNTSSLTNPFCQKMFKRKGLICKQCYSVCMLLTVRPNCRKPYADNGQILSERLISRKVLNNLPKFPAMPVRFHAHGELHNQTHILNLYRIAECNPHVLFTLWTKRPAIVQKSIDKKPGNVLLVYSSLRINEPNPSVPEHFNKVFTVYTYKYMQKHKIKMNCKAKCKECMKCYTKNNTKYIRELTKFDQRKHTWEGIHEAERQF